jgi:hypothetical protein
MCGHEVSPLGAHLEHPQTPCLLQVGGLVCGVVVRAETGLCADFFRALLDDVLYYQLGFS